MVSLLWRIALELMMDSAITPPPPLRLNLGSGQHPIDGWVNVDKFGSPDVRWDLEQFPWPWETGSVDAVKLTHVLEHLGKSADVYFRILQELYRVCKHGAEIEIVVPHPRHDDFLADPTHVRAFTADCFELFSQKNNREWKERGGSNTPLGMYLNIDFQTKRKEIVVVDSWYAKLKSGQVSDSELRFAIEHYNNVVKQIEICLVVNKPNGE
jgi:hypothetical protein